MADRYFRNTTTNVLTEFVTSNSLVPPAGHDSILKSAIRAVYAGEILLGGIFTGTVYTPPVDNVPADLTLPINVLKYGLGTIHEMFYQGLYPRIEQESLNHPDLQRSRALDIALGASKAVYIRSNNSALTVPYRLGYAASMLAGPSEIVTPGTPGNVDILIEASSALVLPDGWTPGHPVSWSIFNTTSSMFDRRALQLSVDVANSDFPNLPDFSTIRLNDPYWIDLITG